MKQSAFCVCGLSEDILVKDIKMPMVVETAGYELQERDWQWHSSKEKQQVIQDHPLPSTVVINNDSD